MLRQAQHERSMIVIATSAPIALSIVEGCAQSARPNDTMGIAESVLSESRRIDLSRLASEIFLSSLQTNF